MKWTHLVHKKFLPQSFICDSKGQEQDLKGADLVFVLHNTVLYIWCRKLLSLSHLNLYYSLML